jgi:hypothetical protein
MPRSAVCPLLALFMAAAPLAAHAVELPSFMQPGDAFCTEQADFDDYAAHGKVRPNSATETCRTIQVPTRVAILSGQGGQKSMIRVIAGPYVYSIGWTNGALPLARSGN